MKKVFADAYVNVPIGAHDITSSSDFYHALPRLIASNIEVRRWIFRLNVDNSNEGYAYLDVDKLSCMAGLRKEMLALLQQHNIASQNAEKAQGAGNDAMIVCSPGLLRCYLPVYSICLNLFIYICLLIVTCY